MESSCAVKRSTEEIPGKIQDIRSYEKRKGGIGKYGVVETLENPPRKITFTINPWVWRSENIQPLKKMMVLVEEIYFTQKGWRANSVRPMKDDRMVSK